MLKSHAYQQNKGHNLSSNLKNDLKLFKIVTLSYDMLCNQFSPLLPPPSVCLSVQLSVHLSVHLSVRPSIRPSPLKQKWCQNGVSVAKGTFIYIFLILLLCIQIGSLSSTGCSGKIVFFSKNYFSTSPSPALGFYIGCSENSQPIRKLLRG